jgi:hypothetical protein
MGWINDDAPHHEGYLVGLREDDWRYIELGTNDPEQAVKVVQVGCDCGWRSPRLDAPNGTKFWPSIVVAPENFEDFALSLWKEHIETEAQRAKKLYVGRDGFTHNWRFCYLNR